MTHPAVYSPRQAHHSTKRSVESKGALGRLQGLLMHMAAWTIDRRLSTSQAIIYVLQLMHEYKYLHL